MGSLLNTKTETDLSQSTWEILTDTRSDYTNTKRAITIPMAQLSTLGAGVSSVLPGFRTVTQTTTIDAHGLYRLANEDLGDVLKKAKDGNYWAAFKTADNRSKMVKLREAEKLSVSNVTTLPVNPATIMMAAALFAIEKELKEISVMEKEILSFLETDKQSKIEGDIDILTNIITRYKSNWDNEHFIRSNHKTALDIKRTARANIKFYQKDVDNALKNNLPFTVQMMAEDALRNLRKKMQYYRLSLYSYSMASFLEIILSGNFKEENIDQIRSEIEALSLEYRDIFMRCSEHLEKMAQSSVDTGLLKGVGIASRTVGALVNSIPIIREGPVDELLWHGGTFIKDKAEDAGKSIVTSFGKLGDPGTGIYLRKMRDMAQIFNHTSEILFDRDQIYLVAG